MPYTVPESWSILETCMKLHTPEPFERLRPPATEKQIAAGEKQLGFAFPADFRESLAIHDGQEYASSPNFLFGVWLYPLEQIIEDYKMMVEILRDLGEPASSETKWFDADFFMFAGLDSDGFCLDHKNSTVLYHYHDQGLEEVPEWLWPGLKNRKPKFASWMSLIAQRLKKGDFHVSEFGHLSFEEE